MKMKTTPSYGNGFDKASGLVKSGTAQRWYAANTRIGRPGPTSGQPR